MGSDSDSEMDVKEKPKIEDYNDLLKKANRIEVKHKRREEIRKALKQKRKVTFHTSAVVLFVDFDNFNSYSYFTFHFIYVAEEEGP